MLLKLADTVFILINMDPSIIKGLMIIIHVIQNNWSEFATTEGILTLQHRNGEAAILYRFLKKTSRIVLLSLRWSLAETSEGLEIGRWGVSSTVVGLICPP